MEKKYIVNHLYNVHHILSSNHLMATYCDILCKYTSKSQIAETL